MCSKKPQISTHSHNIVLDEQSQKYVRNENNQILLFNVGKESLEYLNEDVVFAIFGSDGGSNGTQVPKSIIEDSEHVTLNDVINAETLNTDEESDRVPWSKQEIKQLIALYESRQSAFKSTTVKNEKVWQLIAKQIPMHTALQCKNKFKYMKSKYIKKKDNMSTRATGSKNITFEYFEEFDNIFGEDPNITPIATASSSIEQPIVEHLAHEDNEVAEDRETKRAKVCQNNSVHTTTTKTGKKGKSLLQKQLEWYGKTVEEKEAAKERRHQENLKKKDEVLTEFKSIMEKLMDKLNKNSD